MELTDFIKSLENSHVYIQTHNFPDPDALGSAYGLSRLLEHFHIASTLCYDGKIDSLSTKRILEIFEIQIQPKANLRQMTEDSQIILVDSQKDAGNVTDLVGMEIACIDHHPTVVEMEYQYKDVQMVGACSTIIAQYFKALDLTPDCYTATALLYGIKMDTNQFTRGVTAQDIEMYGYLNPLADDGMLRSVSSNNMEFADLSAFDSVFHTIRVFDNVGIAHIPFSCPDAVIAMVSDFILALNEVDFTVVYAKRDTGWKFSVRSEIDEMDAGEIIHEALLGYGSGGGHSCMAGGMIPLDAIPSLGLHPDARIRDLILSTIARLQKEHMADI